MEPESPSGESVSVAVHVRPLVDSEIGEGCREALLVTPGEPQVGHGAHRFTYDHVFGTGAQPPGSLYGRCVAPLVEGLFRGYNATVFAYGQTGSGKTYTMGSAFTPGGPARGVIPAVMDAIFERVAGAPSDVDFTVRVGFVEIHKEEIHDLLCAGRGPHPAVHIREVTGGGVCLAGATEREVHSRQEMVDVLEHGTLMRATAATSMNKQSSRSHAIFTITLEQRRLVGGQPAASASRQEGSSGSEEDEEDEDEDEAGDGGDDSYLCAKMHLVDLAGSERAKRTKAVGARLQEGININRGLLALGNVINALSEGKAHVPYRDSKLTRMLQDSLGGNSRTLMIACVSPADVNLEESLNTLRYANRARNIRNKPVVNRDPVAAQIAQLRQACAALRAENASLKCRLGEGGGGGASLDFSSLGDEVLRAAVDDLEERNRALQSDNQRLRVERDAAHDDLRDATEKMIVAQAQRDRLRQRLHALDPAAAAQAAAEVAGMGGAEEGAAEAGAGGGDVIRGQLERIAELEREVKRLKQVSRLSGAFAITRRQSMGAAASGGSQDLLPPSPFSLSPLLRDGSGEEGGAEGEEQEISALELQDEEFVAQEQAHTMQLSRTHEVLQRLQRELEAKQAAMQSMSEHSVLRQKYDERLADLQAQRDELQRERMELLHKLDSLQHETEDERLRLRATYEARIKALDSRVKEVAAQQRRLQDLERMKRKADDACAKLQRDIHSIKTQKASLQRQMDKSAREFQEWKRQRDRELLQLKKQGRLNAAQLQKMEALHSKQRAVLRRKTEEAEAARRRLKELEDRKHRLISSRPGTAAAPGAAAGPASAADRPFTAPTAAAAGGSAPASGRPPLGGSSAGTAVERSSASATAAAAAAAADSECQPNQMAPLLRDEKGRREWVEGELAAHCSSFELQKVMEGERAQRSEVQRKLREVEKALAALKAPDWWPGYNTSPSSASEDKLLARKAALLAEREQHSQRFEQAQARLMEARAAEEAKGGVPADARRWNGVRTVVQARALLKTVFRSASQHKAEAMEAQAQLADLNDEIELLKLRLDIAEQEKYEAAQQVAKAEVLLKLAEERAGGPASAADTPAKQLRPLQMGGGDTPADEGLLEAQAILQQLDQLAGEGEGQQQQQGAPSNGGGGATPAAQSDGEEEDEAEAGSSEEESEEEEEEEEDDEEEEEDASEDEERYALWDPSLATPARGLKKARRTAAAAGGGGGEAAAAAPRGEGPGQASRRRRSSSVSVLLPEEQPVLNHLNEQLRAAGRETVARPTVPLMKEVLKGKLVGGKPWRAGSKKREDILRDYRAYLGLQPTVDSPTASAAAAAAAAGAALLAAAAAGEAAAGSAGSGASQQQGGRRSRILEHTASSLARCAATVQQHHVPHHQQPSGPPSASASGSAASTQAPGAPPSSGPSASSTPPLPPPAAAPFGSPMVPAPASRPGSAGGEAAASESTPVGAEGQQTPDAAEFESLPTGRQLSVSSAAGGSGATWQRGALHLPAVRERDLREHLSEQLSVLSPDLGPSPGAGLRVGTGLAAGPRPVLPAERDTPSPRGRCGSETDPSSGGSGSRQSSPLRKLMDLARWGRGSGGSTKDRAASGAARSASPGSEGSQPPSPAHLYSQLSDQCKAEADKVSKQIDSQLQVGSTASPRRLARLLGLGGGGGSPGKPTAKQAGGAAGQAAGGEATYHLQAVHQGSRPASHPLRSNNCSAASECAALGASGGGSGRGSRAGSPRGNRDPRDFRISTSYSTHSPENSGANSPHPSVSLPAAPALAAADAGSGRPRSAGAAAAARPHPSPRKAVWKPL